MRMSQGEPFPRSRGLRAASPAATRRKSRDRNRVSELTSLPESALAPKTIPRNVRRVQDFGDNTQKERAGAPARSLAMLWVGGLLLDPILQGLACMKRRKTGCRDLDALSSLGVPTLACLPLAGLEGAESGDLDLLPGHESGRDQPFLAWGEQRFDGGTRFTCRKTGLSCNGGDEFGLVHLLSPPFG